MHELSGRGVVVSGAAPGIALGLATRFVVEAMSVVTGTALIPEAQQ
jgi:NAD(P)-dependent dehydrogenase (short-subunit alcohol dehydrogenase family)